MSCEEVALLSVGITVVVVYLLGMIGYLIYQYTKYLKEKNEILEMSKRCISNNFEYLGRELRTISFKLDKFKMKEGDEE